MEKTLTSPPHPFSKHDPPFLFANQLPTAESFFIHYPLIQSTIKAQTCRKYTAAYEPFRHDHSHLLTTSPVTLDRYLAYYINDAFASDPSPGARTEMSYLLSMMYLMSPETKPFLNLARRSLRGWHKLTPPSPSTPMSYEMARAFSFHLLTTGRPHAALILLLSFSGYLRASEALGLLWEDVVFPGDARITAFAHHTAGINVRDAKTAKATGEYQFIQIQCPLTIQLLRLAAHGDTPTPRVAATLSYSTYLAAVKAVAQHYGFTNARFTPHSTRIGAATEAFITGTKVSDIALLGRWKSVESVRYYVTAGRAWMASTKIATQAQLSIKTDAKNLQDAIFGNSIPTNLATQAAATQAQKQI